MSVETPRPHDPRNRPRSNPDDADVRRAVARVAAWLATSPEGEPPSHPESLDTNPRRWDVVDPSATRIGHPEDPADDLDQHLRTLHHERDAAIEGNEERLHDFDVARVTQAVCNALDVTAWERDRVLGVVCTLDRDSFGGERSIPRVALLVTRRVVDAERRVWLGLEDQDWCAQQPPERIEALSDRLHRLTEGEEFGRLLAASDLTSETVERIEETLERELDDETLEEAVFGRSPYRDPYLPTFDHCRSSSERT